ncbi:molybdopterin biosynthesis protein [Paeniroseomonas aquatica]|uniref:molybdopterin biosynthesis protein n=1 Tax=Paeniroseomonas aquatica TaxID=373043 RepID=UPI00361C3556
MRSLTDPSLLERIRRAARQEQFLDVVPAEVATARFHVAIDLAPLPAEAVPLAAALGRVVAVPVAAAADAPPFDRASMDGFALRAADTLGATEAAPRRLRMNAELLACGVAPGIAVAPGTATAIATGGVIPRGADAVVMVEHTEAEEGPEGPVVLVRRPAVAGQAVAYAGSDIARGETVLRAGTLVTSREIGMLAAAGLATVPVVRRPGVAILSTGDELVAPGQPLPTGGIYDSNAAILAAAVTEHGGEPLPLGIFRDDEATLEAALRQALDQADLVVMSGGTSKGAGDVSHRILSRLPPPGVLVHGVALKPGKPLCLGAVGRTPVVVLPGFPTSAVFTFQEFAVPVIRALAGLPAREEAVAEARLAVRTPSEAGRTEYVMVSLAEDPAGGLAAWPLGKGSGSVTAFSQADGFFAIDAAEQGAAAGTPLQVRLIGGAHRLPELTIIGSHCTGLDAILDILAAEGTRARSLAVGSLGGLAAAKRGNATWRRRICWTRPRGPTTPLPGPRAAAGAGLAAGAGVLFRPGDARFEGLDGPAAVRRGAADPDLLLVNRNAGSGTRILLDGLLGGARPPGYANQPKSHNAVAAAVSQGRADWGVAIAAVAGAYGLGFAPLADEHYDFFLPEARQDRPAVRAFLSALASAEGRARLAALGFTPA